MADEAARHFGGNATAPIGPADPVAQLGRGSVVVRIESGAADDRLGGERGRNMDLRETEADCWGDRALPFTLKPPASNGPLWARE